MEETLLACQRNSELRALDTVVTACEPRPDGTWAIVLEDTVLYPEGGGQPADRGRIAGVEVEDVQWDGGRVVHLARGPVAPGPVRVEVDWARRFDHMQQHTAQHLLTALALRHLGHRTVGFHLGDRASTIDLDRPLEDADRERLEDLANEAVLEDRPVRVELVPSLEAAGGQVRSRLLRPRRAGAPVRLVEIVGIDRNTCAGTHVDRLGRIGVVSLPRVVAWKGGSRVTFLAGHRVRRALRASVDRELAMSRLLSCGPREHPEAVERLQGRVRELRRALDRERSERLEERVERLLARPGNAPVALVVPGRTVRELARLAGRLRRARPGRAVLLVGAERGTGPFVVAAEPEWIAGIRAAILEVLDARGGGSPGWLQGRAGRCEAWEEAATLLENAPRQPTAPE